MSTSGPGGSGAGGGVGAGGGADASKGATHTADAKGATKTDTQKNSLGIGSKGARVSSVQSALNTAGYKTSVDGKYGKRTADSVKSFQKANGLEASGRVDKDTLGKLQDAVKGNARTVAGAQQYKPGSPEAVALFKEAAKAAGVPESWASSKALESLLKHESNGFVGVPNYTYHASDPSQWGAIQDDLKAGKITATSSATGLGQLIVGNADKYYPSGRAGIGNALEEATGMLNYIHDRYGTPENAWNKYSGGY